MSFLSYNCNGDVFLEFVDSPTKMKLFRDNINNFHSYRKYTDSPTRNIRYNIYETKSGNNIGSVGLSSAVISVAVRDKYIGWDRVIKMKNLCHLANNSRFVLVGERITIKNVGSMTLKQLRIDGAKKWKERYGDDLIMLETFVEPDRHKKHNGQKKRNGAIYLSDNWIEIGSTVGSSFKKAPLLLWQKETGLRGELARKDPVAAMEKYGYGGKQYIITKSPIKTMFIKPLVANWKEYLLL